MYPLYFRRYKAGLIRESVYVNNDWLDLLTKVDFLILDDLGKGRPRSSGSKTFYTRFETIAINDHIDQHGR